MLKYRGRIHERDSQRCFSVVSCHELMVSHSWSILGSPDISYNYYSLCALEVPHRHSSGYYHGIIRAKFWQ